MPDMLAHRGFNVARIVNHMYLGTEGIFGTPLEVSSTFVFMFILFGAVLEKTGLGKFIIDLSLALAGWSTGGPAKVAVVSSGLMGTVSGSSVANVCTTGMFTIPLMKSVGYEPYFAGAVEAVASNGRPDNAAGYGSGRIHHGADTRRPVHRGCDRSGRPGAALLLRGYGAGTFRGLPPRPARNSVEAAPAAGSAAQIQGIPSYPAYRDNLLPACGIHAA